MIGAAELAGAVGNCHCLAAQLAGETAAQFPGALLGRRTRRGAAMQAAPQVYLAQDLPPGAVGGYSRGLRLYCMVELYLTRVAHHS